MELDLRNRLITLLDERMKRARRAARFIFRNHPDTARLFGSTHERRTRAPGGLEAVTTLAVSYGNEIWG